MSPSGTAPVGIGVCLPPAGLVVLPTETGGSDTREPPGLETDKALGFLSLSARCLHKVAPEATSLGWTCPHGDESTVEAF